MESNQVTNASPGIAGDAGDLSLKELTTADIDAWAESGQSWVPVIWHPFVFERSRAVRHGLQTHQWAPDFLVPVSVLLYVRRDGLIRVVGRPRFSRECLEPAAQGAIVLGSVEAADAFYERNPFPLFHPPGEPEPHPSQRSSLNTQSQENDDQESWSLARTASYARQLLDAVCQGDPREPIPGVRYEQSAFGVALPARQGSGAIDPLLKTYDAIETLDPDLPCLRTLVAPLTQQRPTAASKPVAAKDKRLSLWGTLDSQRTLSEDQKSALAASIQLSEGQTLAIHGPPGTGKTAILQEMVAHSVVRSVLAGRPPELLVIASTNNQAIRNALKSLTIPTPSASASHADALLKRRWVDHWPTLGYYDAAQKAQTEAQREGLPTITEMETLERTSDIQSLSMTFIQNARSITQSGAITSIATATEALSVLLKAEAKDQLWAQSLSAKLQGKLSANALKAAFVTLNAKERQWRQRGWLRDDADTRIWLDMTRALYSIYKSVASERALLSEANEMSGKITEMTAKDWVLSNFGSRSGTGWRRRLADWRIRTHCPEIGQLESQRQDNLESIKQLRRVQQSYRDRLTEGDLLKNFEDLLERILHRRARDRWFWLALHVREGQWLESMNATLRQGRADGRTEEKMREKLHRRSLIAPVLIGTLHRLPKILSYWDVQRQAEIPLFNVVDRLIVDEAGQCAPDVAMASASLTTRLIALGDRAQLEPVWSLETREDLGNRVAAGLVEAQSLSSPEMDRMTRLGFDASSGSLLHLTQSSTAYSDAGASESGCWLINHRRCLPKIFNVANELAYGGKLVSARTETSTCRLPPLSFLQCFGADERLHGSRVNRLEACLIAQWVSGHAETLAEIYSKPLSQIVGIITPFKAQADEINVHLQTVFGLHHGITVGTVHSLQGAERPVILFSVTYSATPSNRTLFIDQSTSMLNVAITRAQDCFMVVGDIEALSNAGLPSRLLSKHLKEAGQRQPWPDIASDDPLYPSWESAIADRFGQDARYKVSGETNAAIKLLAEDAPSAVLVVSAIDRAGFEKIGNASIQAVKRGMQVTWLISHEYLLEHTDSTAFLKAMDTVRAAGVKIQYTRPLVADFLILPEFNLALYGESSWMSGNGPKRYIASPSGVEAVMGRLREIHEWEHAPIAMEACSEIGE